MSRILLTWELGQGLGHLMNLRPLVMELAARRHRLFLATRDLSQVERVFAGHEFTLLPAPWNCRRVRKIEPAVTYADLLFNVGFGDRMALKSHIQAWQSLFAFVQPELMICDHSPTALLAARFSRFPVATAGSGFLCPIDESPLRPLRDVPADQRQAAYEREHRLLGDINLILEAQSLPPIERVTQLYHTNRIKNFLLTFPELDHFAGRPHGDYRGAWPFGLAGDPFERKDRGPHIFAYLKPFPTLKDLLASLAVSSFSVTAYIDGWSEAEVSRFASNRLTFVSGPIDMRQAAERCDAALINANHGTCLAMLLSGKPLVQLPIFLEQAILAAVTDRLGVSVTASLNDVPGILRAVDLAITDHRFRLAASVFANRYQGYQFEKSIQQLIDSMEGLISN